MAVIRYLRFYHSVLAVLVVVSYLSGEAGLIHAWFGYGIAFVLLLRLAAAFGGVPQLGLMRFYPHFEGLKLDNVFTHPAISRTLLAGIALCLIGATVTGIAMDRGAAIGLSPLQFDEGPNADESESRTDETFAATENGDEQLGELHELLANLLMLIVAMHVTYLFLFKRPLARFMLFLGATTPRNK